MLPLLLPLHQLPEDVPRPAKISIRGYEKFALRCISVEIFHSCCGPTVKAAECLDLNWNHLSSVNWRNKVGTIVTILQRYYVYTQGSLIMDSPKGSIRQGLLLNNGSETDKHEQDYSKGTLCFVSW